MTEILADRFLAGGAAWIDLATGDAVRLHLAAAGSPREQIAWDARCATVAGLRHPLINPLIDYGLASADCRFEAYARGGAVRASGRSADALLAHAVRFLEAHRVELHSPMADFLLRPVASGAPERGRPVGIVLQRRPAFDAIADALESAGPAGACVVSIAGSPQSGLRTLGIMAARAARLQGYMPVAASVAWNHRWLAGVMAGRHICLIDIGPEDARRDVVTSLIARLGAGGARRHIVLAFRRGDAGGGARVVTVDRMGTSALTGMVFVEPGHGPSAAELFDAARQADGRPGYFLATLGGLAAGGAAIGGGAMTVHETAQPYLAGAPAPIAIGRHRRDGRTAAALARAAARAGMLSQSGRHAQAARLLARAVRVLAARGDHVEAARCALRLGSLSLDRGRVETAIRWFEQARDLSPDAASAVAAAIGVGTAWMEEGKLIEAEAALRTAAAAAASLGDRTLTARSAAALARCLYWQGRFDEAAACAQGVEERCCPADVARLEVEVARVHLAENALAPALRSARCALGHAAASGDATALSLAHRIMAAGLSAAGDSITAGLHIRDGLRVARQAHLPLAAVRLRITWTEIEWAAGDVAPARARADKLVRAGRRWPALVRFQARAAAARVAGLALDRETRGFIDASGAVSLAQSICQPAANPVADLEALLALGHAASDDRIALERICEEVRTRLRATTVLVVVSPDERRVLALAGRPWHGEPHVAWRALGSGLGVAVDRTIEPPEAAEPVRYGGELIGALGARWIAGTLLDGGRAAALLRLAALAVAPNVRAMLDRTTPGAVSTSWRDLLGESAPAQSLRDSVTRAARAPFPVLIEGESGSGKELVARAIHRLGPRRDRRFCAINCAALSDDLLEAELFGHARGAFTGAIGERAGLFEEADGGTLFLDEVGELSARAQAKLLRVLQDGEVRRVGENLSRRIDVRIVAATNRRLAEEAAAGRFRADLRFRLDVVRIDVPPLRDRASDVPMLAAHFWADAASRVGSHATLSPEVLAALARYDWPGNVRELQNVIAWTAVHSPRRGRIGPAGLPHHLAAASAPAGATFEAAREDFERRFVRAALATANGQRARAAETLGVTRQGLAKMIRRLGIMG